MLLNSHVESRKSRTVEDLMGYQEQCHEVCQVCSENLIDFWCVLLLLQDVSEPSILSCFHIHLFSFQLSSLVS